MKKTITINTIFNVLYKLLNMLFPLITSMYLSRVLGPAYLGKVSYAQSIISYFVVFASMGIPIYGMREIAKNINNYKGCNKLFSELFIINLIATIFCSIIYTSMIFMVNDFRLDGQLFFAVGLTLYLNVFNIDWFYSGNEEYVYITVRSFIIKLLSFIAVLIAIKDNNHYIRYAVINSIAITGNNIWNVFKIRNRVKFQVNNLEFKQHLKPIVILLITLLATDLYNYIDITMLGSIRNDTEVGYYSNGVKVIRMICSICTTICATILPRMCSYFEEKRIKDYKELFWQTFNVVVLLAVPCMLGIFFIADSLIELMFGSEFGPTAKVIQVLSPIIIIISISYLCGSVVLTSTGNERGLLKATISGAIVNIFLNMLLITKIGILGAAIASVFGECVVFLVHLSYGYKYIQKKFDIKYIISVVLSALIMCIVVVIVGKIVQSILLRVILSVILGILTYCMMLFVTKNSMIKLFIDKVTCHH